MNKRKRKTTVNVDAIKREVNNLVRNNKSNSSLPGTLNKTHTELGPGTVHRESPLEQQMGPSKYKEMIHGHNKKNKHILDRLPFTFPKKRVVRSHLSILVVCSKCGFEKIGTENTIGFICPSCNLYVTVINVEAESRGYNPDLVVGFNGTIDDRRRLKEELDRKKNK